MAKASRSTATSSYTLWQCFSPPHRLKALTLLTTCSWILSYASIRLQLYGLFFERSSRTKWYTSRKWGQQCASPCNDLNQTC